MKRALLWIGLTALAVAVTVLVFLPAAGWGRWSNARPAAV
jgi:hypothetical protein